VDVIARTDDDFLRAQDLRKGTMQLIDEARAENLYAVMGPATVVSGGSGANTAVGVAALGGRAAFIGKVRDDELGRERGVSTAVCICAAFPHDRAAAHHGGFRFDAHVALCQFRGRTETVCRDTARCRSQERGD